MKNKSLIKENIINYISSFRNIKSVSSLRSAIRHDLNDYTDEEVLITYKILSKNKVSISYNYEHTYFYTQLFNKISLPVRGFSFTSFNHELGHWIYHNILPKKALSDFKECVLMDLEKNRGKMLKYLI